MALFEDEMTDICIKMTIVGAAVFVASYFQVYPFYPFLNLFSYHTLQQTVVYVFFSV